MKKKKEHFLYQPWQISSSPRGLASILPNTPQSLVTSPSLAPETIGNLRSLLGGHLFQCLTCALVEVAFQYLFIANVRLGIFKASKQKLQSLCDIYTFYLNLTFYRQILLRFGKLLPLSQIIFSFWVQVVCPLAPTNMETINTISTLQLH